MAGRNRSLSRDRERKYSESNDDDYRYSDESFTDDEDDIDYSQQNDKKKSTKGGKNAKKPPPAHKNRGRARGPSQQSTPRRDEVAQRMLSAKRLRMNELRNLLEEMNLELKQLKDENKLMKRMQIKQDKALGKYEDRESQLPQLLQRHQNEQRSLRDQLRKARDKYEKTDRYLRDAEDELERTKVKLKKYKSLAEDKGLQERDELNRKLSQAEIDLEEKTCKIKELQKHNEMLKKNHRHELGIEIARTKEAQRNFEEMKSACHEMEVKMKEKEKELQLKNIYSNRRPHHLPASYSGTPQHSPLPPPRRKRAPSLSEMSSRDKAKIYENRRREEEEKKREKPIDSIVPSRKVPNTQKHYNKKSLQSREEYPPKYHSKSSKRPPTLLPNLSANSSLTSSGKPYRRRARQENGPKKADTSGTWEDARVEDSYKPVFASSKKEESFSSDNQDPVRGGRSDWFSEYNKQEEEKLKKFQQDREEQARKVKEESLEQENRERDERERRERAKREEEKQRREHEERARRERQREEQEKREQEERERKEREKEEQKRREQERWQQEKEERERRAREERELLENDEKLKEERRKKDELLAKLRALDNTNDPFAVPSNEEKREKTPIFTSDDTNKSKKGRSDFWGSFSKDDVNDKDHEKTKTHAFMTTEQSESGESHRSNYSFTKPTENLHHGRPSHEDIKVPYIEKQKKQRARQEEDAIPYEPSFGSSKPQGKTAKQTQNLFVDEDKVKRKNREAKKKNLLSDLFPDSKQPKNETEDIFIISDNNATNKNKSSYRISDDFSTRNKPSPVKRRENSSTLFGGGSALIEDDDSFEDKTKILPRRPRQSNTYQSKPAVTAIQNNFDDELEEVIL